MQTLLLKFLRGQVEKLSVGHTSEWEVWGYEKLFNLATRNGGENAGSESEETLLAELNNLISGSELVGVRVRDIKDWVRTSGRVATKTEIRQKIRELERRNEGAEANM
jgi:hypothetical protein